MYFLNCPQCTTPTKTCRQTTTLQTHKFWNFFRGSSIEQTDVFCIDKRGFTQAIPRNAPAHTSSLPGLRSGPFFVLSWVIFCASGGGGVPGSGSGGGYPSNQLFPKKAHWGITKNRKWGGSGEGKTGWNSGKSVPARVAQRVVKERKIGRCL